MNAIRIENLRSLADTGFIELKPITLLLGQNNSGKSTFLRAFPLFRQSVESRTTGPILWYGQFVDFGSFQETLNKKAKEKEIAFHFLFNLPGRPGLRHETPTYEPDSTSLFLENLDVTLTLKISEDSKREGAKTSECSLAFAEHVVRIKFGDKGKVSKFIVNSQDFSDLGGNFYNVQREGLIPYLSDTKSDPRSLDSFLDPFISKLQEYAHPSNFDTALYLAETLRIGSSDRMLQEMKDIGTAAWKEQAASWSTTNENFQQVRDLVIAANTAILLALSDRFTANHARSSYYVPPVRATAERYYRLQNLAVDEVDFQRKNLAMFLRGLTDRERKRFAEWTEKHFGFTSFVRASGEHVSLTLRESGSTEEFNLADKGFGFSQVLPILIQLWLVSYERGRYSPLRRPKSSVIFAVEQPELHLHPHLQAKLADSFIDAIEAAAERGLDLKLIIETHSETIVNQLGHRVAKGDIDHQDINVVIFEKEHPDAHTQVRLGNYDEEGFLVNWPFGFFEPPDEG